MTIVHDNGAMVEGQVVRIGGRRLRVSHLDKVLYPETGTTKGEVLDYYVRIAPWLIPHASARPATRKRWPDGVGTADSPREPFFAKALEQGAPEWIDRAPIDHSTGAKLYPLIDDAATLAWLAQGAALELHAPQWRFGPDGRPAHPDRLVLDLDPGPDVTLADCARVARWCREILAGMGLEPFPVTSGSKGIHLYAALPGGDAGPSSDDAAALARELARAIESDHPDRVTSSMATAARAGRVFIDWSQNSASKTTILPYSLRGLSRPFVAAPRTWDELDDEGLAQLDLDEVLRRAESGGDPLAALGFRAGARRAASGPLSAYIAKRSATRTPEPVPDNPLAAPTAPGEAPRFVIQEHHATRLHWDVRLEHDGVFVSWAVPRGLPAESGRNHLAVMTEDHPLEYGSFAGTIPRGEYGAGTVTIWDEGRYDVEKWRDDEVIVTLHGRAGGPVGSARFAFIRTSGEGEKSSWLLHRTKTDASGAPQTAAAPVLPTSVDPAGERPGAHSHPSDPRPSDDRLVARRIAPMLAVAASPELARTAAARWQRSHEAAWVEAKWDGVRAIGVWDGRALALYARSGTEITARYPEVTAAANFGDMPVTIDGEIVARDNRGRPSFSRLQARMHLTKPTEIEREAARTPVEYYLFDAPSVAGSLDERRRTLEALPLEPPIVVPPVFDDVDDALSAARALGLEGIVVKDPASPYRPGSRSDEWLKVKFTHTQDVVIGGIRAGRGARTGSIGSLLVGVQTPAGLRYAGRVGTGFSERTLERLQQSLEPLRTDDCPFLAVPEADRRDATWVLPELVGEVTFAEWTPDGSLRHASWRGLRADRSPGEVVRET